MDTRSAPVTSGWTRTNQTVIVCLAILGIVIATIRAVDVSERRASIEAVADTPARLERDGLYLVRVLAGIENGTSEHSQLEADFRQFFGKFDSYPFTTLVHVGPAALFTLLVLLQFSDRLRQRAAWWHRWAGRVAVTLAVPLGISGLLLGILTPFGGRGEASAIILFGAWFFVALISGVVAIRRRDTWTHRKWMIRMVAVALGVVVVRLWALPLAVITRDGPRFWFAYAVWLGFSTSVWLGELWIGASFDSRREATSTAAV